MSAQLSIGNELKDSFKDTYKWVAYNLKWLNDVEQFYIQRSKIEREYSEKLKTLTAEYFNKKSTSTVALSVGENPSITPGSVESAVVVSWNEILSQTELVSRDHGKLSADFEKLIAGQLNGLYTKLDMTLAKIASFNNEIDDKRMTANNDLEKAKKTYDESCQSMETARNKYTKSGNERNKRKMDEKELEMHIAKNDYLIKISQANRIKDKYYFQDVPESVDLLQDLNECKVLFLNDIWKSASSVETTFSENVIKRFKAVDDVVSQNNPSLSTAMFIKHNVRNWTEPRDFQYKPSPIWHEEGDFAVPSNSEANDLRLKLARAEKEFNKYSDVTQTDLSKLASFNKKKAEIKSNPNNINSQDYYDNVKNYLAVISPFTSHETLKLNAEVAIESIQNNVPAEFDLSTDNIDVSAKRKTGGLFSKLKNNLLNPGLDNNHSSRSSNGQSRLSVFSGTSNRTSSRSHNDSDSIHTVESTTTTHRPKSSSASKNGNKVLFAYEEQDDDETSISPGDDIELVAADSGSGWTHIKNITKGTTGLVPTSYVSIAESSQKSSRGPAPNIPPPRRTTIPVRTITAAYDYTAQGDDELSIHVGDIIHVIKGDDGSGWTYGELDGKKGLVPSSYCK